MAVWNSFCLLTYRDADRARQVTNTPHGGGPDLRLPSGSYGGLFIRLTLVPGRASHWRRVDRPFRPASAFRYHASRHANSAPCIVAWTFARDRPLLPGAQGFLLKRESCWYQGVCLVSYRHRKNRRPKRTGQWFRAIALCWDLRTLSSASQEWRLLDAGTGLGHEPVGSPQLYLPIATPEILLRAAAVLHLAEPAHGLLHLPLDRATHKVTRRSRALRFLHQRLLCSVPPKRNGCLYKRFHEWTMTTTARRISPVFWPYGPRGTDC